MPASKVSQPQGHWPLIILYEMLAFKTGYATLEFSSSNDGIRFKDGLNGLEVNLQISHK